MKGTSDPLEAIAQPVTEYDLCNQMLNGLGPEYDPFHTSIMNCENPMTFEEMFEQLLTFELRLELHHSTSTVEQSATAFYTTNNSQGRSGPRGRGRGRGRGRTPNHRGGSSSSSSQYPCVRIVIGLDMWL